MNTLFIDLASHSTLSNEGACIACIEGDHTKAIHFIDERINDKELFPVLERTMISVPWKNQDIQRIACVIGPGGFTSLRMAVTLANTLGDQLGVPVAGVHLSDVFLARFSMVGAIREPPLRESNATKKQEFIINGATPPFLWIHATKKQELFVRSRGDSRTASTDNGLWPEPTLISLADLVEKIPEGAVVCGEILPDQRSALAPKKLEDAQLRSIADALPSLLDTLTYSTKSLEPWYGRGW